MAAEFFSQRRMDAWTWDTLTEFLAEEVPEGPHLEYKEPHRKPQGAWQIKHELVETIVAMANTNDGLLIVGVADAPGNRPGRIVGVEHSKPSEALRTWCAAEIEPPVPLEIQSIAIPPGEKDEGKFVIIVRIRRGSNPPYLLRTKGVYVRNGDQDRHASVRELQALFERREELAAPLTHRDSGFIITSSGTSI